MHTSCRVDFSSFLMFFLICIYKLKRKVNIHILRLPAESLKICCKLSGNTHRRTLLHLTNLWTNRSMVSRVQTGKVSPVIFSFKMVVCWGRGEGGFYFMSNMTILKDSCNYFRSVTLVPDFEMDKKTLFCTYLQVL